MFAAAGAEKSEIQSSDAIPSPPNAGIGDNPLAASNPLNASMKSAPSAEYVTVTTDPQPASNTCCAIPA